MCRKLNSQVHSGTYLYILVHTSTYLHRHYPLPFVQVHMRTYQYILETDSGKYVVPGIVNDMVQGSTYCSTPYHEKAWCTVLQDILPGTTVYRLVQVYRILRRIPNHAFLPGEQAVKSGYSCEAATHDGWVQSWIRQLTLPIRSFYSLNLWFKRHNFEIQLI